MATETVILTREAAFRAIIKATAYQQDSAWRASAITETATLSSHGGSFVLSICIFDVKDYGIELRRNDRLIAQERSAKKVTRLAEKLWAKVRID